jgi:hypothetical protein
LTVAVVMMMMTVGVGVINPLMIMMVVAAGLK